MSSEQQTSAESINNSEDKQTFTAEEIEKQLDKLEEEENVSFDEWFNSYVGADKANDENTNNDENKEQGEANANNNEDETNVEPTTETVDSHEDSTEQVSINDVNESHETTEPSAEPTDSHDESDTTEQVSNEDETNVEPTTETVDSHEDSTEQVSINEETNESQDTSAPLPEPTAYTLSDVQGKKKVKTDVHIQKHRKHRSRKTELTQSLPPKEPIVLQETEQGRVEISKKKGKKLSDKELEQEIDKAKTKITTSIQDQVEEMEKNGNCRQLDMYNYTPGSDKYNMFKHYLLNPLLVPKRCITKFSLNEYINSITIFNYNCFDTPNVQMQHPIPEKVIFTEKLNNIFNYQFVSSKSGDFHFADLDAQILKFISTQANLGTLKFEYQLIKSSLGKLILNLNTDVELALRDNTRPTLNSAFKQVIIKDIQYMKYIQDQSGKTFISWKTFLDTLLGLGSDKLIYVHDTYRNLNTKLDKAYSTDLLVENLIGNTLKCYLPSVALNYFYAIKSIYVLARLISIYIQLGLFKKKTPEQVANDLYTIGVACTIMYENKSFIFKQASRTLPSYDKPLSNETKLYILNHLLTGGQYYILKMLEESVPVIASDLVN